MGTISGNGQAQTGLGGAEGFGEILLDRSDDGAFAIDTSAVFENGFAFGGGDFAASALYVATDGFITFGAGPNSGYLAAPASLTAPFIAAFMADIDTRLDGEGVESGPIWVDIDSANDVVTITWADVGFYRRNADLTNTFQIQLFDRGAGGMDIVLRYDTILWTAGDVQGGWDGLGGTPATAALRMGSSGEITPLAGSGNEAALLTLPSTIGNTGQAGLWVYNVPLSGNVGGVGPPQSTQGSSGNDSVSGTAGADTLLGQAGNDLLEGAGGADLLDGGAGNDLASYAGAGMGVVASLANPAANTGDAAGDSYIAVEGILGSAFADTLVGDSAANILIGGGGDDWLIGGAGADTLIGGAGTDWADYSTATVGLAVSLTSPAQHAGFAVGDDLREIEGILGSAFDDTLIGAAGAEYLSGGAGRDLLRGEAGADTLEGGDGNDTLMGGAGADMLRGGAGIDWASYILGPALRIDLQTPSLNTGDAMGDTFDAVEGIIGSASADILAGDASRNSFDGGAGDDLLQGRGGDDSLLGGAGNDTLIGGAGADTLIGGAGFDFASYSDAASAIWLDLRDVGIDLGDALGDTLIDIEGFLGSAFDDRFSGDGAGNWIEGGGGNDVIAGHWGADTLRGNDGNDTLNGGADRDALFGDAGADWLIGGEGMDSLFGGADADRLVGDSGNDALYGGIGNDRLIGGAGRDFLFGGSGADLFQFTSTRDITAKSSTTDVIFDFVAKQDKIDLSAIDASRKLSGNNAFTFDGTKATGTSPQGDIYYRRYDFAGTSRDYTLVFIDVDADASPEAMIFLTGLHRLTAGDFIL
jgi:Ca2+-binding RTX toxin-like protein